jgi:tetratricopeptide (TPR) repeat protein
MADTKQATESNELLRARLEAQKKDKIIHLLVGLIVGFLVGFFVTNMMNRSAAPVAMQGGAMAAGEGDLPDDHPPVGGGDASGAAMPAVQEKLKKAEDNPNDFAAQMEAAQMFHNINNSERALFYLQRAYKLKPDDYNVTVNLANGLFDTRQYTEAKPLYEKAVQLDPKDVNARTDLGTTYFQLGDFDKALETYRASLAIDPKHEYTLQNLALVALQKGDVATAEDALTRLAAVSPQNKSLPDLRNQLNQLKTTGKIPTH